MLDIWREFHFGYTIPIRHALVRLMERVSLEKYNINGPELNHIRHRHHSQSQNLKTIGVWVFILI